MDLLLWRHAEAVDGTPDHKRPLTRRGERQAKKVAHWLKHHQPRKLRILVSPTVRTLSTVSALTDNFTIVPALGPDYGGTELLAMSGWPETTGATLLVGHQPGLGELASLLLTGGHDPLVIRKGALWWFSRRVRDGQAQVLLRTIISPDML